MRELFLSIIYYTGIGLLITAAVLATGTAVGWVELPDRLFAAETTVHSLARLAVVGCLCAAIGSHDF